MTIEAINEQLLRAIGVGVALLNRETLQVGFRNDTFDEWFSGDTPLDHLQQLFPAKVLTLWQISVVAAWTAPVMVSCWQSMGNGRALGTPWKRFPADAAVARA